jgi:Glyoxalase superfamily protein
MHSGKDAKAISPDAKSMARTLRLELEARQMTLSHGACLEVVAKQHGYRDWNTMSAATAGPVATSMPALLPLPKGWEMVGGGKDTYDAGILANVGPNGGSAMYIGSKPNVEKLAFPDVVYVRQIILAKRYRGKRVRFAATLASKLVATKMGLHGVGGSGIACLEIRNSVGHLLDWLHRFNLPPEFVLAGDRDWIDVSLVLEVPHDAETIELNLVVTACHGHMLASGLSFGITDEPLTPKRALTAQEEPQGLDLSLV